jgi:hypothetical protein
MKKRWIPFIFLAGLLMAGPAFAEDRTIEATGEGVDLSSARREAQRSAIEQAVGVYVDSKTVTDKYEVIEDKIRTHAQAFLKTFEELGEPTRTAEGTYIVRIKAVVSDDVASLIKDDLTAVGIQLQQVEYPEIMAFLDAESTRGMPEFQDPEHVYLTEWAVDAINSTLGKRGFDYVTRSDIEELRASDRKIFEAKGGKDSAIRAIANHFKADYYLKFKIHKENGDKVAVSLNLFDASTGAGKGSETGYSQSLRAEPSITRAITQATAEALERPNGVIAQLLNTIKRQVARGNELVLVFDNIRDDDQLDEIHDALEAIAKRVKLNHSTGEHAEFTLYTDTAGSDFPRALRKALKNKVTLDGKVVSRGNRINLFVSQEK